MVNFKSPVVAEQDFNVVLKHLWHTTHGIFIWEYITTLEYEWDVIRGRRPYRWTIWVYSLARTATLISVILNLIQFNILTPINCQTLVTFELIFSYMGLVAASLLIVFRIVAVWNKNKLASRSLTNFRSGISYKRDFAPGIVRIRSAWNPLLQSCVVLNTEDNKANIIVTFISDVILLGIMLIGLLILRRESGIVFPLGSLLWNQGIIWLAIATAAEVPPSASSAFFLYILITDPHVIAADIHRFEFERYYSWNLMFQFPSLIAMSIAATRMYRSLSDFVFGSTDILSIVSGTRQGHSRTTSKRKTSTNIQLNRIEVAVDVDYERHQTPETTGTDEQLDDKSHKSKFGSDLESAMEN
ncbi:hypothetical protein DFH94DRAFT_849689 [Russula ochroleuca]|uniref:Uncharacterized protein n=1 Tax=Russula ochroleuca TaxID=152965 RepID=A0A9P5N5U6_9AGAM|nr:hypothetical protein DFH94DRAFT_849689 [Russula ochroleuca]